MTVYREVVSSYAFIPGACIAGGVALGAITALLDTTYGDGWIGALPLLGPATTDGARGILTTAGGAMLSVAGIVFSITLAAIVFASGQYGPHVLPQYRRDRFSQATLGVLLAVFAYCMTVLYTVHGGDETLVPRLAVFGALALTAVGMIMLTMFLSHMLGMLHVSNVIARIGRIAIHLLEHEMPLREEGAPKGAHVQSPVIDHLAPFLTEEDDPVLRASGTGYVLTEATPQLVALAHKHDVQLDVLVRPGDHVTPMTPIMRLTGTFPEGKDREELLSAFAYGSRRTPDEDVAFTLDELCAIGLRALSPGINDPYTAGDVIHQLTAVTERAARGRPLDAYWQDEDGTPRVRRPVLTFSDVVRLGLDRIATDAASNVTVAPVMVRAYDVLLSGSHQAADLDRLRRSSERFGALCAQQLPTEEARERVAQDLDGVVRRASEEDDRDDMRVGRLQREAAL